MIDFFKLNFNIQKEKCLNFYLKYFGFFWVYRKNGTQDPERTQDRGPYEDPGPYEDSGPYEVSGPYKDPGPYEDLGPHEDPGGPRIVGRRIRHYLIPI